MHLKYRPKTWEEVIGNNHIVSFAKTMKGENSYRPIMLEGGAGQGKTTMAYLIANDFTSSSDNIEDINCVHYSGVDAMRSLMDEFFQTSLFGNEKVLILDEIHELSDKAQQCLLKPLESLPKGRLIIACTTTTEKVKKTLLDRFLRMKVKPISEAGSIKLVDFVVKKEGFKISKPVLALLLKKSEGVPRKLLTGLSLVRNVTDISEAEFILDLESMGEYDVLDFFKVIMSTTDWGVIKGKLVETLGKFNPSTIRFGLMNLIASRLTSKYYSDSDTRLIPLYEGLAGILPVVEKSGLIVALYTFIKRG